MFDRGIERQPVSWMAISSHTSWNFLGKPR
jgi:hypothetical protein